MEDSLDCCRQCMMIRQTRTTRVSVLTNIAVRIIYDLRFFYTLCVWEEIGDVLHGLGEDR